MGKSVIIIGAGIGGMSAGIYGRMRGMTTRIYEMHSVPGGQCTSWKRKGYTFDACIHHLMGCAPGRKINRIWSDIGAVPFEMSYSKEYVSVLSSDGKKLNDYYDPEELEKELLKIAPEDSAAIRKHISQIKSFFHKDIMGEMMLGGIPGILRLLPFFLRHAGMMKITIGEHAKSFTNPFLREALPQLVYSMPEVPYFMYLALHSCGYDRDIAWPEGGSAAFAASIAKRYEELGGKIEYNRKVTRILTKDDTAIGVQFADGSQEYADIILSNADGRKTLLELLEGRYMNEKLRNYCGEPEDETNWAVHVFLGVNRDLSKEPSHLILMLDRPVTIAGHDTRILQLQTYGNDRTMAPEGKGVIKVDLVSKYSYWKELSKDRSRYEAEKKLVAGQVIDLLGKHFPGIGEQIEAIDVPTILTWERFMGGTHGFANFPSKKIDMLGSLLPGKDMTVTGLKSFCFAGAWTTSAGALFVNALSGKRAIEAICKGKV